VLLKWIEHSVGFDAEPVSRCALWRFFHPILPREDSTLRATAVPIMMGRFSRRHRTLCAPSRFAQTSAATKTGSPPSAG
jgi:hypothetical protein